MQATVDRLANIPTRKGVVIQKPDLDTCLTALILGVTEKDKLIALPFTTTPESLLNDPAILCIEAGGTGQTELNNFDHHDAEIYLPPACKQAYQISCSTNGALARLVSYVAMVDDGISPSPSLPGLVQLSHLFSGLLLFTPSIEDKFLHGITLLQTVLRLGINPFVGLPVLPEWLGYLEAWRHNKSRLVRSDSAKELFHTAQGRLAGLLQHSAIGGFDLLYKAGCDIAILSNSVWVPGRIRKYTIGSRRLRLNNLLAILNRRENGWGGRAQIIGSPRQGSILESEEIKTLVANQF